MAEHRRRVAAGRELARRELLAVFHFNRGVTFLRENRFDAAVRANLRALALDPRCRPACENFAAAAGYSFMQPQTPETSGQRLLRLVALAWDAQTRPPVN